MAIGEKTGGRTAGTPNKDTKAIREKFAMLVDNNVEQLQTDLDAMKPKDRVDSIIQFAKFVMPTLKAVEFEDLTPKEKSSKFEFNFVKKG